MNSLDTIKQSISTSTWRTSDKSEEAPITVAERLRKEGKNVVILEGEPWSFVCVVDDSAVIPEGEEGLRLMREAVRDLKDLQEIKSEDAPPFTRGFVGFLSYDLGMQWQEVEGKNHLAVPPAKFFCVKELVAFHQIGKKKIAKAHSLKSSPKGNLSPEEYAEKIDVIHEHLLSGETYQINFSQRFEVKTSLSGYELYTAVSAVNGAPMRFFLETEEYAVVSNSPERLFKLSADGVIETAPIKGTVPRGATPEEDEKNIERLLASKKEEAELMMITDLARNDLGKICVPGSVHVPAHRAVEKYSHVIHTVSKVRGHIAPQYDWYDALRALFPGGSVTGCPKKRSMEIIEELEEASRGIYCGSAGYIDLSGACDFNIMIRTVWLQKSKEGNLAIFRSGGAIVADSVAEQEYDETLHKAGAFSAVL